MTDIGEEGRWRHQNGARVLSRDPLIVTGTTLLGHLPIGLPPLLSPRLADRPMTYLVRPSRRVAARLVDEGVAPAMAPVRVAEWLNRARVGLCLSRTEGGMLASVEYLLCGLPVVSTASLGGRDRYFDPDHTRIVDDDPDAVAAAVADLAAARIDPREIRSAALAMMRLDRRSFVAFVQVLIDEAGGRTDFAARFPPLLARGLFPETAIADLVAEARG